MTNATYNATKSVASIVNSLKPPELVSYKTGRSGLVVEVAPAIYDAERHNDQPAIPVRIDGTVDQCDALQLADFFKQLADGLKGVVK
jgi:hypothetical protein